jgi:hypothetical protein
MSAAGSGCATEHRGQSSQDLKGSLHRGTSRFQLAQPGQARSPRRSCMSVELFDSPSSIETDGLLSRAFLSTGCMQASSSSISLVFAAFAGADRQRTELVSAHGVTVHISVGETTTADLLAELGAPSQTFEKVDDRLGIHRPASSAGAGTEDESAGGVGQPCSSSPPVLRSQRQLADPIALASQKTSGTTSISASTS